MPTELYRVEIQGKAKDVAEINDILKENGIETKLLIRMALDLPIIIMILTLGVEALNLIYNWYKDSKKRGIKVKIILKNGTILDLDSHTAEDIKLKLKE